MLLSFLTNLISKVLLQILQSPAKEVKVETVDTTLHIDTSIDDINTQYQWMLDRS